MEAGVGKRKRDDMADLEAQLPEVLLGFRVALTCYHDCDALVCSAGSQAAGHGSWCKICASRGTVTRMGLGFGVTPMLN